MKNRRFLRTLLLIVCLLAGCKNLAVAAAENADFDAAGKAYAEKDFPKAIEGYESLVGRKDYRPEIFYNLALAYERSANPAKAVLNFERALLLLPNYSDAQSHLDRLLAPRSQWWEKFPRFGSNASILAIVCAAWIFLIALVARWRVLGGTKNFWTALIALSVCAMLIAGASAIYRDFPLSSPDRAIVLHPEMLHSNFTESSPTVLTLTPGQSVWITSINGDWTNCILPDRTRGWVSSGSLERVIP